MRVTKHAQSEGIHKTDIMGYFNKLPEEELIQLIWKVSLLSGDDVYGEIIQLRGVRELIESEAKVEMEETTQHSVETAELEEPEGKTRRDKYKERYARELDRLIESGEFDELIDFYYGD